MAHHPRGPEAQNTTVPRAVTCDADQDDPSDTSSVYSSMSEDSIPPIYAYGHTYHGSGRVWEPNDESSGVLMTMMHNLYTHCLDGELTSTVLPTDTKIDILDVGSGNGLWACEMAQKYPKARILGIDLTSAVLPKDVPPNLTFEIADAEDPWPDRCYDFIHIRHMCSSGGIRNWPDLLTMAFAHLKPGGQLEFSDIRPRLFDAPPREDGSRPEVGEAFRTIDDQLEACARQNGVQGDPLPMMSEWMTELGAERVRQRSNWLPVTGNPPGDPKVRAGSQLLWQAIDLGLEHWTLMMFGKCGWSEAKTRELLARVKVEMQDPRLAGIVHISWVMGEKPHA